MLDGRPLIDAHQHPVRLPTVKRAWLDWAERYGQPGWREAYDSDGVIVPQAFDDLMRAEPVVITSAETRSTPAARYASR